MDSFILISNIINILSYCKYIDILITFLLVIYLFYFILLFIFILRFILFIILYYNTNEVDYCGSFIDILIILLIITNFINMRKFKY